MADVSNRKRVQKGIPAGGQFDAEKRPEMGATLDLGAGFGVAAEGVDTDKLAKKSVEFRYASADMSHGGKTYTYAGLAPTTNPHGGPVSKPRDILSVDAYLRSTGKTLRSLDTVHLYDEDGNAVWGVVERTSGDLIGTSDEIRFADPDSRYRTMDPQQAAITKACEDLGNDNIYRPNADKLLRLGYSTNNLAALRAGLYAGAERTDSREITPSRALIIEKYGQGRVADLHDPDIEKALLKGDEDELIAIVTNDRLLDSSKRHDLIATVDPDRAHRYDRGHSAGLNDYDLMGQEDVDTLIGLNRSRSADASANPRDYAARGHSAETIRRYGSTACELFDADEIQSSGARDGAVSRFAGVVPLQHANTYADSGLDPRVVMDFVDETDGELDDDQRAAIATEFTKRHGTRLRAIDQAIAFQAGASERERRDHERKTRAWQMDRLRELAQSATD